jgi:hypothetical protein
MYRFCFSCCVKDVFGPVDFELIEKQILAANANRRGGCAFSPRFSLHRALPPSVYFSMRSVWIGDR